MSRVSPESRVAHCEDVVFRELDGEAVILNLGTGAYYGLDPVGTRIWELIQERGQVSVILEAILNEFEVEPGCAEQDLFRLLGELEAQGLIRVTSATAQ